jgi:hypothetical protein
LDSLFDEKKLNRRNHDYSMPGTPSMSSARASFQRKDAKGRKGAKNPLPFPFATLRLFATLHISSHTFGITNEPGYNATT